MVANGTLRIIGFLSFSEHQRYVERFYERNGNVLY
jgi:hypothetical protein